jgi:hypothetical protein
LEVKELAMIDLRIDQQSIMPSKRAVTIIHFIWDLVMKKDRTSLERLTSRGRGTGRSPRLRHPRHRPATLRVPL